ncbi:MAG: hypothetical protein MI743_13940 [Sneathiellales bacterium]|nr:hypothetical protein [Sneathiellales bacterium]
MSENYLNTIRACLEDLYRSSVTEGAEIKQDREILTLRPPKNPEHGDLCSNILLLLQTDQNEENSEKDEIVDTISSLDCVSKVDVESNGYLNIQLKEQDLWVCIAGMLGDLSELYASTDKAEITLPYPKEIKGLAPARQKWNAEALARLAEKTGSTVHFVDQEYEGNAGFPYETALSKCGEQSVRVAVLSNAEDYTRSFSPVLATDRSYDNPVFCLPYAHARIKSMLEKARVEDDGAGVILLEGEGNLPDFPVEQKLVKMLCDYPRIVERSLALKEILHLVTFLQDLSLLFFRLVQQLRPQSTDYLTEPEKGEARRILFLATDRLICEGLELLEFDIAEEFI